MPEPRDCPQCGLVNPPEAQRCDCGWDFQARQQNPFQTPPWRPFKVTAWFGGGLVFAFILVRVAFRLFQAVAP